MNDAAHRGGLLLSLLLAGCTHVEGPADAAPASRPRVEPLTRGEICAHLRGGPAGAHAPAADLGRAHALVRYFGIEGDVAAADARLADALDAHAASSPDALIAYGERTPDACFARADAEALAPATVVVVDDVAVVSPGTGSLPALPSSCKAIAIDVRALPETEEARAAAMRALDAVLHGDIVVARIEERRCNGQPDEVNGFTAHSAGQYVCKVEIREERVAGQGRDLPLAVLTGPRLTPLAAWVAVALRASTRARIIGDDVPTALAESRWVGVGEAGLAVRTGRLVGADGTPLPDLVPADHVASDPRAVLRRVAWSAPVAPLQGPAHRSPVASMKPPTGWGAISSRRGDARAAVLTAHAATRTFFPYLAEVGDPLDARLDESLAMLEETRTPDRPTVHEALRRFAEALHDGHTWISDDRKGILRGSPVALVPVGDDFAVALSSVAAVRAGDVVVRIDGAPTAKLIEAELQLTSGSPHAARAWIAERIVPPGAVVDLRHPDGTTQTVAIPMKSAVMSMRATFDRKPGPLADHGAPGIFYLTLEESGSKGPSDANLAELLSRIDASRGLILDLRGYPSRAAFAVLAHVAPESSLGPRMAELVVTPSSRVIGPWRPFQTLAVWTKERQGYAGPVVVLTGPLTQSRAEHWLSFFRSSGRGKVVGGRTSGANGTITGVQLPGGYGMTFTGMLVQHTDGARFHALGHIPDVEVEPTVDDLRHGRDAVLLRAIEILQRKASRVPNRP